MKISDRRGKASKEEGRRYHLLKISIECYWVLGTVLGIGGKGNVQNQKYFFLPLRSFTSSGELDIKQTLTQINFKLQL